MKKSVLVTSILFSTMMLGTNILINDTKVSAEERIEEANEQISNKIQFISQSGRPVYIDNRWSIHTVSGRLGDDIKLNELLPEGYTLYEKNQHLKFEKSDEIRKVRVNGDKVTNKIDFIDIKSNEVLKSKELTGKIGDIFNFPSIPEGYHTKDRWDREYVLSADNRNVTVLLIEDEKEKDVELKFLDAEDNLIDKKRIRAQVGENVNLNQVVDFDNRLRDYRLADSQPIYLLITSNPDSYEVRVKKNYFENILYFMNGEEIIGKRSIRGEAGELIDISKYIPEEYALVNSNDSFVSIKESGNGVSVKVKKDTVKNWIQFRDSTGKLIDESEIEGKQGSSQYINRYIPKGYRLDYGEDDLIKILGNNQKINMKVFKEVTNKIKYVAKDGHQISIDDISGKDGETKSVEKPDGYKFVGSNQIKINSKDGYVHTIVLEGKEINTTLIFVENRKADKEPISKEKYSGRLGDNLPNEYIPDGYVLLWGKYQLTDNQFEQRILLRKKVKTTVNYRDSFGKLVGKQESTNPDGDNVKLRVPKGYLLVNNASQTFGVDQEHPVQNVLVVPTNGVQVPELPNIVSTQINLINRKDNKVIHSYVAQGIHGQSMNIQIPTGYDLAKGVTNKLTLDKSKKLVNIYMVEKEGTNTTGVTVPHSKTVLTKKTAHLYDKNGKEVTNRALGVNSGWKSDQMMVLNGETYYRVATNEYVKVSDIVEYQMNVSTVKTSSGSAKYLYDVNGKKSSDRALAANTAWFTDKAAVINGEKMYRVATNEWVKASDID